jgi:hypothetical protein
MLILLCPINHVIDLIISGHIIEKSWYAVDMHVRHCLPSGWAILHTTCRLHSSTVRALKQACLGPFALQDMHSDSFADRRIRRENFSYERSHLYD